jgi:hypothetical protein
VFHFYKEIFSIIAIILTIIAYFPYISSISRGDTSPHLFTWIIWGLATIVIFLAQLADGGGVGTWSTGISGCIALYVALLAYINRADTQIYLLDWLFFSLSLLSLLAWHFTSNPLWAVVILTLTELLAFIPTFRKAYIFPYSEKVQFFLIVVIRNIFAIIALEHYSMTTIFFPAVSALACLLFSIMVFYRRRNITD